MTRAVLFMFFSIYYLKSIFQLPYTLSLFSKQPVYKQLALGHQISGQLSGLSPLSLSNNKNCRQRKMEFLFCNKRKTDNALKFSCLKSIIGKILKSVIINIGFESASYCISRTHRLLGQTTKQPLSNFKPQKPWKHKQLSELKPEPSCL